MSWKASVAHSCVQVYYCCQSLTKVFPLDLGPTMSKEFPSPLSMVCSNKSFTVLCQNLQRYNFIARLEIYICEYPYLKAIILLSVGGHSRLFPRGGFWANSLVFKYFLAASTEVSPAAIFQVSDHYFDFPGK